jgi:hypothetical protein
MSLGAIVIILDKAAVGPVKYTRFSVVGDGAYPAGGSVGLSYALATAGGDARELFDARKAGPNGNLDFEYTPMGAPVAGSLNATSGLFTTAPIPQGAQAPLPAPAHGLVSGQAIFFEMLLTANTGSPKQLPAGLTFKTPYYVLAAGLTTTAFAFSATPGGSVLVPTSAGVGILNVHAADKLLVRVPSTGVESAVADQSGSTYTLIGLST